MKNLLEKQKPPGAGVSAGDRRNWAGVTVTSYDNRNSPTGQAWPPDMTKARQRGVDLARRGHYHEAAAWLDRFYSMHRRLAQGGAQ